MANPERNTDDHQMSYADYAPHYDNLCDINPAYQELTDLLRTHIPLMNLPDSPRAIDIGAGTGNFICTLLDEIPDANVTHIDSSPEMNRFAAAKYLAKGLKVELVEGYVQDQLYANDSHDLLMCVNVLNNIPPALPLLRKFADWTRPGGTLFLIDFGREINVVDWTWYLFKNSISHRGLRKTVGSAFATRKAFRSNRKGQSDQSAGRLWTHSTAEITDLATLAGFQIAHVETCYRGYADLVICRKPIA